MQRRQGGREFLLISAGGLSDGVCVGVGVDEEGEGEEQGERAWGGRIGGPNRSQMKQQDERQQAS